MVKKTTLLVLLLIGFTIYLPFPVSAGGRPVLVVGSYGALAVADAEGEFFGPKAQGLGTINAMLEIPLFCSIPLAFGVQFHAITTSSLSGGWAYRPHWGGGLRVSTGYAWKLPTPSRPLDLKLGAAVGASFNLDLYTWTTLFIYYPGLFLEPYLEIRGRKRPHHSLALALPIDYYFRRDLDFYGSIGIGVVWRYTLQ